MLVRYVFYFSPLLEETYCFRPVCLSVTKDCMFYFYIYISNKNSLKLCILAVNHIKIQILLWQIHSTIFAAVLSSFMTYHLVCNYINTTGATSGAGTAYPCGTHKFTPGFQWGSCYLIFSFMCIFCRCRLSFCTFSFGHCVVCSSFYGF